MELAAARTHLSFGDLVECELALVIQAHAAAGRGVGFVTDYPRLRLQRVAVAETTQRGDRVLGITPHAAWSLRHFAASRTETLMEGLASYFETTETTTETWAIATDCARADGSPTDGGGASIAEPPRATQKHMQVGAQFIHS